MLRFDAVRSPVAENENLTAAYRDSFLPVVERSVPSDHFRWHDEVYHILDLVDVIGVYRKKRPEVFEALYDEHLLEIACLCWKMRRQNLTRRHRPKRKVT